MSAPRAYLIATGNELADGRRPETNGEWIARHLESLGFSIAARCLVPDDSGAIEAAIGAALQTGSELILISGGLGPTADDRTREAIAAALHSPLRLDAAALERIERRYLERGREVPPSASRQAQLPEGCEPIANPIGTAPGILARRERTILAALPGVPREFQAIAERDLLPMLRQTMAADGAMATITLRTAGMAESEVDRRVGELGLADEQVTVTFLAMPGQVDVLLTAKDRTDELAAERIGRAAEAVRHTLGEIVYGTGNDSQVSVLRDLLVQNGWSLAVAESLTGGLLAKRITDLPGSSRFFEGSIVAYKESQKVSLLGLGDELLQRFGAVSAEAAAAMARATTQRLHADAAIATTGIAGPEGGSVDRPVGLVFLATHGPFGTAVTRHLFAGARSAIRVWSVVMGLDQLRRALLGLPLLGQAVDPDEGLR